VTVVIALYNQATTIVEALSSVDLSTRGDFELVVVDDASTDGGWEIVREWMSARPHYACRLVRHLVNRGLANARNTGSEHARTGLLLMLDADNLLRRVAIDRLMCALEADRAASFAYGILERFSAEGPVGLLSQYGWDPTRLRMGNYIDALALVRREALKEMGGYSDDPRLYGWEDYDLWARMAEEGRYGVFVPEIIARYRVQQSSMLSITGISVLDAMAAIVEHAPRLMHGTLREAEPGAGSATVSGHTMSEPGQSMISERTSAA
jgi:glycosyltransferase involved in cell wall biosynthesis